MFGKMKEEFDICGTRNGVVCSHLSFWVSLIISSEKSKK